MSLLSKVAEFVSGPLFVGLAGKIIDYFPRDMSQEEKLEMEIKLKSLLHEKEMMTHEVLNEAAIQLDKRISQQEGTASDLKSIPVLGSIMLFLRGVQRPAWGFGAMVMDYKWFFGAYTFNEQQQTAMIVINFLVLGFLFGERTIKNLEPLIIKVFAKN